MDVFLVALGGALGSVTRYLSVLWAGRLIGPAFPYGTMAVNVVGSFLMGLAFVWLASRVGSRAGLFAMTGFLGGFTTFSAYSLDAFNLWSDGRLAAALGYVFGSVVLSIAALAFGVVVARGISG